MGRESLFKFSKQMLEQNRKRIVVEDNWQKFMLESNTIERDKGENETGLNPGDKIAFYMATNSELNERAILSIHKILTEHLNVDWSGKYRNCRVRVGDYIPEPTLSTVVHLTKERGFTYNKKNAKKVISGYVQKRMKHFVEKLPNYNSWQAYMEFENIHPFEDFNGRTGRLIWLSKAINEGYDFRLSFLEKLSLEDLRDLVRDNFNRIRILSEAKR